MNRDKTDLDTWLRRVPQIAYVVPREVVGGFCLTGTVFEVYIRHERFGRIVRSWRNLSRWEAAPVFWLEVENTRGASGDRRWFDTLEETIIHLQEMAVAHVEEVPAC